MAELVFFLGRLCSLLEQPVPGIVKHSEKPLFT